MAYLKHVLMESRNGLVITACVTVATGTAEREAALAMLSEIPTTRRVTLLSGFVRKS